MIMKNRELPINIAGKFWLFLRCFLPMIILTSIQIACSFAATFYSSLSYTIEHPEDIEGARAFAKNLATDSNYLMKIMIAYDIIGLIVFGIYFFTKVRGKNRKAGRIPWHTFPVIVILFAGLETLVGCFLELVQIISPDILEQYLKRIETMGLSEMTVLSALVAIVFTPVLEEIVYRAITLNFIEKFSDIFWFANIMQAAIFGMAHLNLVQGIYAFFMGLILGYVYKKYNSLWASILGHIAFNITGTFLVPVIFGDTVAISLFRLCTILIVSTVVVVWGFSFIKKDKKAAA